MRSRICSHRIGWDRTEAALFHAQGLRCSDRVKVKIVFFFSLFLHVFIR